MERSISKREKVIIVLCAVLMILCICTVGIGVPLIYTRSSVSGNITISQAIDTTGFDTSGPSGSYIMSEEEFEEFKADDTSTMTFSTYEEYVGNVKASFIESSASFTQDASISETNTSITATGANAKLYNYCDKYFQCYYGDMRISPVFPLAIANVETGGRADHSITWSSLFPSAIVDVSLMDSFDVTTVLSDERIFKALTSDYSTRDRGALQMSPTYGTGNSELNKRMSGSEKDKLSKVDTSTYSSWCSGASSLAGDRFYIPDMLLRLQAAMNYNVQQFVSKGYTPINTYQLLAMLSVGHNSGSGVFSQSDPDAKVGNWYGAGKCYEWCGLCSDNGMITALQSYTEKSGSITIDTSVAEKILGMIYPDVSYTDYTSSKTNAYYPIKFLYTYLRLSSLYTQ